MNILPGEVITDVKKFRMVTKNGNKTRQTDKKVERSHYWYNMGESSSR